MSNIKFKIPFERIVIMNPDLTKGKVIPVGTLDEYEKTDKEQIMNVRLNEDIPDVLRETIEQNPSCLRVMEVPKKAVEILIIPSRPTLIT